MSLLIIDKSIDHDSVVNFKKNEFESVVNLFQKKKTRDKMSIRML